MKQTWQELISENASGKKKLIIHKFLLLAVSGLQIFTDVVVSCFILPPVGVTDKHMV